MSVTEPSEPRVVASVTVSPPVFRLLLLASRNCTVIVEVEEPSAMMEVGAALMSEAAGSAAPGPKFTVAVSVMAAAFTVPVMVAVPVVVAEVRVAV